MPSLQSVFAKNLKQVRSQRGYTQSEVAERAGVSQTHIAELESGKKAPSLDLVESAAVALGVRPWELLLDDNDLLDGDLVKRLLGPAFEGIVRDSLSDAVNRYLR